jgi:hypothetical protein
MVAGWKAVLAQIEALPDEEQEELVQVVTAEVRRLQARARGVSPEVAAAIDKVAKEHFESLSKLA